MTSRERHITGQRCATSTEGKNKNTWTVEQRTALRLIFSTCTLNSSAKAAVFNDLFEDELAAQGLPHGLPFKTLQTQYKSRNDSRGAANWKPILQKPRTPKQNKARDDVISKIAAASLRITARPSLSFKQQLQDVAKASGQPNARDKEKLVRTNGDNINVAPRPSKRRRPSSATPPKASESEEDATMTQQVVKRRQITRVVVSVQIPVSTGLATPPSTPRKKSAQALGTPTVQYVRRDGPVLYLTPQEHKFIREYQYQVISEDAAHPPLSALLFRTWHSGSQGLNGAEGFVSGRHANWSNVPPTTPSHATLDYADIFNHVNPKSKVPSPFVSVTNCFGWVCRKALKAAATVNDGHITIIRSDMLDKKSVFYLPPYHRELMVKKSYTDGGWNYAGRHEFLVFHQIPARAIVHTFTVHEFVRLAERVPALGAALRLNALVARGGYDAIQRAFKKQDHQLTPATVTAIAKIAVFIGLDQASPMAHIAHIVSDFMYGWGLAVETAAPAEWAAMAAIFAYAFARSVGMALTGSEREHIKLAFIFGAQSSGGNPNWHHSPKATKLMLDRAKKVGLGSPTGIIVGELVAIAAAMRAYQRIDGHPLLLQGIQGTAAAQDDDSEEDSEATQGDESVEESD